MSDYSDEELMRLVKDDDKSAFEELFSRYNRRIFSFFYRMIRNAEEARDCAQETFLRLWEGRAGYAPEGNRKFSTYLFSIAMNHFLDRCRKRKARVGLQYISMDSQAGSVDASASSGSAYRQAVANEIRSAISEAMSHLPETHRLVYFLSEGQRMSYREIAETLDCPVGTVSSRKVEAIKKLRRLLQPLWHDLFGGGLESDNTGHVRRRILEESK